MSGSVKEIEASLSEILSEFNEVLQKHGVDGQVLRFMVGDRSNPSHVRAQEKIEEMLSSLKVDENPSPASWICCDEVRCYECEIA